MDVSRNYLLGSMQLFVTAAGTIGNFLVILVILSNRSLLRNIHYYLVLHLAICDFFTLMFPTSLIYHAFTGNSMLNSQVLCKLWRPAHAVFYNAGVLFMVIISVVRFQAVLKPLEPGMRRWKVKILAMSAYIFAIVWTIPYVLVLKMKSHKRMRRRMASPRVKYLLHFTFISRTVFSSSGCSFNFVLENMYRTCETKQGNETVTCFTSSVRTTILVAVSKI